jgi:ribosomal protein S27AE
MRRVYNKVWKAISRGKLVKEKCEVCGAEKTQAHHDDYNKPLEIRWLCKKCHTEWHLNNKPIAITEGAFNGAKK